MYYGKPETPNLRCRSYVHDLKRLGESSVRGCDILDSAGRCLQTGHQICHVGNSQDLGKPGGKESLWEALPHRMPLLGNSYFTWSQDVYDDFVLRSAVARPCDHISRSPAKFANRPPRTLDPIPVVAESNSRKVLTLGPKNV